MNSIFLAKMRTVQALIIVTLRRSKLLIMSFNNKTLCNYKMTPNNTLVKMIFRLKDKNSALGKKVIKALLNSDLNFD
jgi:hypothetical protein